jgi:hypothetical protein
MKLITVETTVTFEVVESARKPGEYSVHLTINGTGDYIHVSGPWETAEKAEEQMQDAIAKRGIELKK